MSIPELKKTLQPGDQLWIAKQLPGNLNVNMAAVCKALKRNTMPKRKNSKEAKAIRLALIRVEMHEKMQQEYKKTLQELSQQ